ncbi:MAG: hypothetical protein RLZZ200_1172 [Pseudomonadota bacterium]|jgi:copper(I)-binding protein
MLREKRMIRCAALLVPCLLLSGVAQADIEASGGWTRATPPGTKVAVGYLALTNTGKAKRELVRITSPAAKEVTLHQSSTDDKGVSRMWPIGRLELAPGEKMRLEPNGRHMMLEGLGASLTAGGRVPVTLVFDGEKPVTVQLEVRPLVEPAGGADPHAGHDMHHH